MRCSRTRYSFRDGYLHPGDAPGHGVDIDEKVAAQLSVQAELAPGQPAGGRLDVELVKPEPNGRLTPP